VLLNVFGLFFKKSKFYRILVIEKLIFGDFYTKFETFFVTSSGSLTHFERLFGFLIFL